MHKFSNAQEKVITSPASSILVLAGPGSGKTSTMIGRIRRLIASGVKAAEMVIITFTNAAAGEIVRRISEPDKEIRFGYIGTLHGFCLKLLQEYGSVIGYGKRVTVLDDEQAIEMLLLTAKALKCRASENDLLETKRQGPHVGGNMTQRELAVQTYFAKLRETATLDFDMILFEARRLLDKNTRLPWSHLFVDEYQDSGNLDATIYRALPCKHKFFVGDPDQAIYGFRGGNIQNILTATVECELHLLEENYRSALNICTMANKLIRFNRYRHEKLIRCMNNAPGYGTAWVCKTDDGEAAHIATHIGNWIAEGSETPDEIAVLCRSNSIAAKVAQAIEAAKIPVRKKPVNNNPEDWSFAKLTLDLLVNPNNETIAGFWINHKFEKAEAEKLKRAAKIKQCPLISLPEIPPIPSTTLASMPEDMARLGVSRQSIEKIQAKQAELISPTLLELAFAISRDTEQKHEEGHGVTVTTIHAAKGREWSTVIICGCEQEVIPGNRGDLEEERRIMFVAVTRAKQRLVVSYSQARRQPWGRQSYEDHEPSQFLLELSGDQTREQLSK